jgi:hypothetical protein
MVFNVIWRSVASFMPGCFTAEKKSLGSHWTGTYRNPGSACLLEATPATEMSNTQPIAYLMTYEYND